jgi:hypothetical protein
MRALCPGQDTRFWRSDDIFEIACSRCGTSVEFFRDDTYRRCGGCGARLDNPKMNLGCAQWCEHARECLGYDPRDVKAPKEGGATFLDRLIESATAAYGAETAATAIGALEFAEKLLISEKANPRVTLAAALLSGLGSGCNCDQAPVAGGPSPRSLLTELGAHWKVVDEVCALCSDKAGETPEIRVVQDATALSALRQSLSQGGTISEDEIKKRFLTDKGRETALRLRSKRKEK